MDATIADKDSSSQIQTTLLTQLFEGTIRAATSWFGLVVGYFAAISAAVIGYDKLGEPLKAMPPWVRPATAILPLIFVLAFHTIPTLIDQRRRRRLAQITGDLKPGYFRLTPRDEEESFTRFDNKHEEIRRWLAFPPAPVLYLTGQSGSGKSSILAAWVIPKLAKQNPPVQVIRLRGYQNPVAVLSQEILKPGVIWSRPPVISEIHEMIERARKQIKPNHLLIVFDQFEEFVILNSEETRKEFAELLASIQKNPIEGVAILLVLRSDYIGVLEELQLPKLVQDHNWKEVSPFTEAATYAFLQGTGLKIDDTLLEAVLREASEIEQTKGLIRPITANLCGLVISRFRTGLPRNFRPGRLIYSFLLESMNLPEIRETAPKIIPRLITAQLTKVPRSVDDLSMDAAISEREIKGCLRKLAMPDRGIVRALDSEEKTWEISHDFLAPQLDSIFARWSVAFRRRIRPWVPWITAAAMAISLAVLSIMGRHEPVAQLTELGWVVRVDPGGHLHIQSKEKPPWRESVNALRDYNSVSIYAVGVSELSGIESLSTIRAPISLSLPYTQVTDLSPLRDLKNLSSLDLRSIQVEDVSPLRDLKNLSALDLSGTKVKDISPLRDLKNLSSLKLSSTQVKDVSPLRDLQNLSLLDLTETQVKGVLPLRDLKNLASLDLSGTKVEDLSPLRDLKNLASLNLNSTQMKDVSLLRDLKNLGSLDLSGTKVEDLSPLRDLKNLSSLNLNSTQVKDVSPLRDLKNLSSLDLSGTKVKDISPLRDLKNLSSLNLNGTQVEDVSPLRDLKNLSSLDLSGTKVEDLSPLRDLKNLSSLDLSGTKVEDLSPLRDLKNLSSLNLNGTQVKDVSLLRDLKNLGSLDLSGTKVEDLSPLRDLKNLSSLDISETQVKDESPLFDLNKLEINR